MTRHLTVTTLRRAVLGLVMLLPSAIAPLPATAQAAPPAITFSPGSVAPGGQIVVMVSGFACEQSVTIELVSRTDPNQIFTLGSIPVCSKSTQTFDLSSDVPVDVYEVRATDQHSVRATGRTPLTVKATGATVNGTASCTRGAPLLNAQVDLYSGSDLVGRTKVDSAGGYSFTGLGPDATYLVEYTQYLEGPGSAVRTACGTTFTTNADGFAKVGPAEGCPSPDGLDHGSWDDAYPLTNTVAVPGAICGAGQSFWARLAISPGSTVFVSVSGGGSKTRVELFRDLRKEADLLLAKAADPKLNVRQLTASLPGLGSTPWDSSPWDSSPWDSSPWDSSPWDSSPWDSSPWDSSPWDSSPCPQSACGGVGLKDAPVYSAVEQRAMLARSTDGQITRNTWDNSGDYYIRVFNQDAAFDPTQKLTLSATAGPVCGSGKFNKTTTPPAVLGNPMTLILVNTDRLRGNNGLLLKDPSNVTVRSNLLTQLNAFAALPNVKGRVIDLANDPQLADEYVQWDKEPSCVPAANIVSESIHDLIAQYRAQPGSALKYVTLAGGHTAGTPYRLTPDFAEIQQEKRFNPGLLDQSETAASLGSDYVMSDDYFISFTPISHLESEINLPEADLAVGRLVETAEDITANLQTFNANGGVLKPKTALASGYTFVKDLAAFEAAEFTSSGLTTETGVKDVAHPQGLLISDSWTMPDLKAKLFAPGARFDLLALNWHATASAAVAADYDTTHPTVLTTADLEALTPDGRFGNALIMSIGCHLAYNVNDLDVIGQLQGVPVTNPRDFVQVLSGKGAMVLGNTGYGYGDTDFMGYSERLLGAVTQELQYTDYGAAVPVGLALTRAKRNYVDGAATLTHVDKKAVEELTFYGPPMWSVALPVRATRPTVAPLRISPVARGGGLSAGDVTPPYTLSESSLGDGANSFFSADGGTVANNGGKASLPYRAVAPFKGFDMANPALGTARGLALLGAEYQDLPAFHPLISRPATEEPGATGAPASRGFTPILPFGSNELIGQSLVVTPFQWSTPDPASSIARRYLDSGLRLRTYYSARLGAAALAGPASISHVAVTAHGSLVHVEATIRGATAADLSDVLLSYTAIGTNTFHNASTGRGKWVSCNLVPDQIDSAGTTASCLNARRFDTSAGTRGSFIRRYSADIETAGTRAAPTDLRLMIQAVTGTGLVSVAANNGLYHQVVTSAVISMPKHSTSIVLRPPASPSPYDHAITVSATLQDLFTQQVADGEIVFTVGSQRVVARTAKGQATATMTILELPGNYRLTAAFLETPTLRGSIAASDFTVIKKATSLTFGRSPYLVTLKDADGHLLRDEAVFFNVRGRGRSQTLSAQTGRDGVARLRGLTLPAGRYRLMAYFLGAIPFDTGKLARVDDDRFTSSSARTTLVTGEMDADDPDD